jgi:transcriptional regulator with XRE-family HTH domain
MKPRKPPSEFAIRRGRLIRRARREARWSQARLAEELGVKSRELISQYESGSIEQISVMTCRALVLKLGLRPQDLAEDTSVFQFDDELPTMSTEARRVARRWDSLPEHLRKWITDTIDGLEQLEANKPVSDAKPKRSPRR